ncbi:MAG TPA: 50S ribosomal protein L5 [Verrucomicrobiales bacterium]|jgi:large subunit ribosomal protein L5|nr:50S ribosomal protein L5 [Verrucomicrobiales bacterium]
MKPRLYSKYHDEVKPALKKDRNYTNLHQVPRIEKIIVHMGLDATLEKSALEDAMNDMKTITGRKPVVNLARKSVSNFKLREGMPIGCHVTLRREVMYEFLDRLTAAALPRIRDFRGINPKSFDGQGNYSMGITEQSIFPEIELDKVKRTQGMDVTIVTSANTNDEALDLLTRMGMPFAGKKAVGADGEAEEISKTDEVAELIFTACKGAGTDEEGIRNALFQLSNRKEWDAVVTAFAERHSDFYEGDIMKCLDGELNGKEMSRFVVDPLRGKGIEILEISKVEDVADRIAASCEGAGTDEGRITDAVYQIQSREEWDAAAAAFSERHDEVHGGDLMKCLTEELSEEEMETHVLKPLRERDIKILDAPAADSDDSK